MRNVIKFGAALVAFTMLVTGCEKDQEITDQNKQETAYLTTDNTLKIDLVAQEMAGLLNDAKAKSEILTILEANKKGILLEDIISDIKAKGVNEDVLSNMNAVVTQSNQLKSTVEEHGNVQIPEVWLYNAEGDNEVLVAYPPEGDEEENELVKAYRQNGDVVFLDMNKAPENYDVIVIDPTAQTALSLTVELVNKALQENGVQAMPKAGLKATGDAETTLLSKIKLSDDKEPWIKGDAEVYAVTSGIRTSNGEREPQVAIIDMPYLDKDGKTYTPNQVVIFWDDYEYQAANIQLFEHDSNYNYKELVKILTNGAFKIAGLYTQQPIVAVLGELASAIIEAMPDDWYTDDDDYVDSYYTIMKNKTYTDHRGAAQNATATFTPLTIPAN